MAEARRNLFTGQLADVNWLTNFAQSAVTSVVSLGRSVGALVRRAERRLKTMMDFADNTAAGHTDDDLADVPLEARHGNLNAFLAMADTQSRDEQLMVFAEHQVVQTIVAINGSTAERDQLNRIESGNDRYIAVESEGIFSPLCAKVEEITKHHLRQEARQQQQQQQQAPLGGANGNNDDDSGVGGGVLVTPLPKGLSGSLLMDELSSIAQLSVKRLRVEALKHALKEYKDLREDFIQYTGEHKVDLQRSGEAEVIRQWIEGQLALRDPVNVALKALAKAKSFVQAKNMSLADYLQLKRRYCSRAKTAGENAGDVASDVRTETDWCTLAIAGMLTGIQKEVKRDLASNCAKNPRPDGYGIRGYTSWAVMTKQANSLATQLGLDPDSSQEDEPVHPAPARGAQSWRGRGSGRGTGRGGGAEAFAADGGRGRGGGAARGGAAARGGRGSGMLCSRLPGQTVFKDGDQRTMPPRQDGGPENQICVYAWHGERCVHGGPPPRGNCRYRHGITKEAFEAGEEDGGEEAAAAESTESSLSKSTAAGSMDSARLKEVEQRMHKMELASVDISAKLDQLIARAGGSVGGPEDKAKAARRQARHEAAVADAAAQEGHAKGSKSKSGGGKQAWYASSSDDEM